MKAVFFLLLLGVIAVSASPTSVVVPAPITPATTQIVGVAPTKYMMVPVSENGLSALPSAPAGYTYSQSEAQHIPVQALDSASLAPTAFSIQGAELLNQNFALPYASQSFGYSAPLMQTSYGALSNFGYLGTGGKKNVHYTSTSALTAPIVQQAIYEELPTITNKMLGVPSQPIVSSPITNAAIFRQVDHVVSAPLTDYSKGPAKFSAVGSIMQQPIVQQTIYQELPTVTNDMLGVPSQPIAAAPITNAAIVRRATVMNNQPIVQQTASKKSNVGVGVGLGGYNYRLY
jgi:hypothetical protein